MSDYIWTPTGAAEIWEQLLAKKREEAGREYRRKIDKRLRELKAAGKFAADGQDDKKTMKYIIKWKFKYTNIQGRGSPLDKETAAAWVEESNRRWPGIFHWLEPYTLPTISGRIPAVVLAVAMMVIVILLSR
jgi:hypothetical protein